MDGTKNRGTCLGYWLLLVVDLISEELAEVAIEAAVVTGAVDQLVKEGGIVVCSVYKPKAGGKMNRIGAWTYCAVFRGGELSSPDKHEKAARRRPPIYRVRLEGCKIVCSL